MTDEMNIQERPSAAPYLVGGAVVGGAGGYGLSKIKAVEDKLKLRDGGGRYTDFNALIQEANKGDSFQTTIDSAQDGEKTLLEQFKTEYENAANEFDRLEADKRTTLPDNHEAQKAYNEAREKLINDKIEVLKNDSSITDKSPEGLKNKATEAINNDANVLKNEKAAIEKAQKEEFIKEKLGNKEEFKKLYEKGKHNWKFYAAIGGTAVVGALLGLLFRPGAKNEV